MMWRARSRDMSTALHCRAGSLASLGSHDANLSTTMAVMPCDGFCKSRTVVYCGQGRSASSSGFRAPAASATFPPPLATSPLGDASLHVFSNRPGQARMQQHKCRPLATSGSLHSAKQLMQRAQHGSDVDHYETRTMLLACMCMHSQDCPVGR